MHNNKIIIIITIAHVYSVQFNVFSENITEDQSLNKF